MMRYMRNCKAIRYLPRWRCSQAHYTTSRLATDGKTLADFIQSSNEAVREHDRHLISAMNFPSNMSDQYITHAISERKQFYIETYGCQMNSADTEIVNSILMKNGYQRTETCKDANVILLNTCAIRENAEAKIWNRLEMLRQDKVRLLGRRSTRSKIPIVGVLGCMAERLKTKLLEADKMVDLVVGPDAYRDLPNLLDVVRGGHSAVNVQLSLDETYADIAPVRMDPNNPAAFVSIMRGCNNMCSYCIVPFTRGRERSRELDSIVQEVGVLRDQGVKEVVLLGQNVNSYHDRRSNDAKELGRGYVAAQGFQNMYKSRDSTGYRFVDVLDRVSSVDPEIRVRFTSPHPKDFPDDVLDLIAERSNLCSSIHMPAQSGSTSVLQRMRRGYSREAYLDLVENIRSRIPGVAISSDFIAGFCGETDEEHEDTLSLMQRVCYDQAFMFAYSMRERTHASHRMQDDVPQEVKIRRLQEIIKMFSDVVTIKNRLEDSNRLHVVLVQGASRRSSEEKLTLTGLTDNNKRCVFADIPMPTSLRHYKDVKGSQMSSDAQDMPSFLPLTLSIDSAGVRANPGDYVLVHVHEAARSTLHATPIARTTLAEVNSIVPKAILGSRPHVYHKLER